MKRLTFLTLSIFIFLSTTFCFAKDDELSKAEKEQQIKEMVEKYVMSKYKGPNAATIFSDRTMASIKTAKELEKPLTVSWADQPLSTVVDELRSLTKLNFVIHKDVPKDTPISLKMKDVKTGNVIKWVLRSIDQKAGISEGVIMIAPVEKLVNNDVKMVIYDISDLTLTIKDFPSTDIERNPTGLK